MRFHGELQKQEGGVSSHYPEADTGVEGGAGLGVGEDFP